MEFPLIRPATPADTSEIIALLGDFHAEHLAFDAARWTTATPPHTSYAAWLSRLIDRPEDGAVFVVETAGRVVGYSIAEVEEESTRHWSPRAVYIHDLFIVKAQRRLGLARQLIQSVFDWSAATHPDLQLRLMTATSNEPARTFFAKLGFMPCVVEMIRPANLEPQD